MGYPRDRFYELYSEFLQREKALLSFKRDEYTPDGEEDCLANFRQIAVFEDRTPEQVCMTHTMKHIQSIMRAINTGRYHFAWEVDGGEGLKQRIADARNYLALLAAILDEKSQGR